MTDVDWEEVTRLRGCVERWLRIKFEQDGMDTELYRRALGDDYERVVLQLRNDALHSGLLMRLFQGEEPT
jgi:hypothetical protein